MDDPANDAWNGNPVVLEELDLDMPEEGVPAKLTDPAQGQHLLESLLDNLDKRSAEWLISISLTGVLDFRVLQTRGYGCIRKIVFQKEGKITDLRNLPKNLLVLEAPHQFLTTFSEPLPPRLEELVLYDNRLTALDLSKLTRLVRLNVNSNLLTVLQELPSTLEVLLANDNHLTELDLSSTGALKTLHVSNNPDQLTIRNLPRSLVDFKSENTRIAEVDGDVSQAVARQKRNNAPVVTYESALNQYFQLVKLSMKTPTKCVNCKKAGRTIFQQDATSYTAKCGATATPCALNIQLYRGVHKNALALREQKRRDLQDIKDEFIRLKLDTVYAFITDKKAAENYKTLLAEHTMATTQLEDMDRQLSYSPDEETQIAETRAELAELRKMLTVLQEKWERERRPQDLHDLVELQTERWTPLTEKLRKLRKIQREIFIETNSRSDISKTTVFTYEPNMTVEDYLLSDSPAVIRFTT